MVLVLRVRRLFGGSVVVGMMASWLLVGGGVGFLGGEGGVVSFVVGGGEDFIGGDAYVV